MKQSCWLGFPLVAAILLPQLGDDEEIDRAREIAAIEEHTVLYERAFNAGDVEDLMSCYGDTYHDLNAATPETSREARKARMEMVFRLFDAEVGITSDEILLSDDGRLAVQRGVSDARYRPKAGGTEEERRMRYVEVLRRDDDGHWRVVWGLHGPIEG